MSIKAKISLDSSELKKGLNQAEQSVKQTGKEMVNATEKLDNIGDNADRAVRAIDSVGGALGQASTGISGIAGDLVDLVKNPMAAAIAAIGTLVALAVKLWDKLTLSAEEYAQKATFEFEQATKKYSELLTQQEKDTGYLDRLREISQEENISNAVKSEAITLITTLTERYGNLGISIDLTTGKITGLDQGMAKAHKKMLEFAKEAKKLELSKTKEVADSKFGLIHDGKRLNSGMTPLDFGGKSFGTSMAHRWAGYDVSNKGGIEDLSTSFLSSDKVKEMAKQVLDLREKMKSTTDEGALKVLKDREEGMKNLIRLQLKLEVAEKMATKTAQEPETAQKWRDVTLAIQELILRQKEYNALAQAGAQAGNIDPEKQAAHISRTTKVSGQISSQLGRQEQFKENIEEFKENAAIEEAAGGDKLKIIERKLEIKAKLKLDAENSIKELEKQLSPIQKEIKELLEKQKNGVISSEETERLFQLTEKSLGISLQIETSKASIAQYDYETLQLAKERDNIEAQRKKYVDDMVASLENEASLLSLRLKGLDDEATKLELINQLKEKGIELSDEELNKIIEKRKQLGGLKLKDYLQGQNESLDIQEKRKNGDEKEALRLEVLRNAERIKGAKLTTEEIKNAERLADRQWKLRQNEKSGSSSSSSTKKIEYRQTLNIRGELTNELARRGGFASSVVRDTEDDINKQIMNNGKTTNQLLTEIRDFNKKNGVIQ